MDIEYFAFLVSLLSAVIAVVAIVRARAANQLSEEANKVTRHYNLRPMRLDACNLLSEFAHYCTTYRTLFLQNMVTGTSELMDRRDNFRKEFAAFGPLGMSEVEAKAIEFSNKAVHLQRALDRSRSSNPKPLDSSFATLEDNIDAIADWFASEKAALTSLFNRYLVYSDA